MRNLPPLAAVRVFEAAARHENFTSASAELGMTQAAVSYQIRVLEERLGIPLFHRAKGRVTLSDAGKKVAANVSAAFDTLSSAFSEIVEEDDGILTISAAHTMASNLIAPRLGSFQIARPELAVRLQADNQLIDFARDNADLAIRTGRGNWPGLKCHFLFRVHFTLLCTPEFREQHGLDNPAQLLGLPRLDEGDQWWPSWLAAAGVAERPAPSGAGISLDSQVMAGNAALAGHGAALLTPLFWKGALSAGRLVQPFPVFGFEEAGYWLVYPEHKRGRPKISAFRNWLLAEIAREAAAGPAQAFAEPAAD